MKKAIIIFNGIQFHYYLLDHAIEWATTNQAQLMGLFIHSDKEPPEGYIFPSDIDPAENLYGKKDAQRNNEQIIKSQMKIFEDLVKGKNIAVTMEELSNPSLQDVTEKMASFEQAFVDGDFDQAVLLPCTHITLKKLIHHSACPVEAVRTRS